MTDITDPSQTVAPPEIALTPLALPGQPATDRGFTTPAGTRLRARIVTIAEVETRAPTNTRAAIAPSGWTLSLTLAVLDAQLGVAADEQGRLLITDRHEIHLSDEAMRNPDFDVQADIERTLRQQAFLLEQRMTKRAATTSYLASAWGGAATTPAEDAALGLTPATGVTHAEVAP